MVFTLIIQIRVMMFTLSKKYSYDIVILAETHIGFDTPVIIENFNYFPVCRDMATNGRYYGGLAIFRKKYAKRVY